MAKVAPPRTRASFSETPHGLELLVPARKSWFVILYSGLWMIGWAYGEFVVAHQLLSGETPHGPDLFLLAWLIMWTTGGGFIVYSWLWSFFGRERVVLRPSTLEIAREMLGLARRREYDLAHIRNLRVAPQTSSPADFRFALRFLGVSGGSIAFDYGARTFRFAAAVDEAEASAIVERLKGRSTGRMAGPVNDKE